MKEDYYGFVFYLVVIAIVVWFAWLDDSKLRYDIQYDAEVTVDDKPKDCDFLTSPLSRKNCKYEKRVSATLYGSDDTTGKPVISYDGGDTWEWNEDGPLSGGYVTVYWEKVDD